MKRGNKSATMEGNPSVAPSIFPVIESNTTAITIIWDENNTEYSCIFCKRTTVDEIKLGPLYRLPDDGVITHYFCMLFSSGLSQHGNDHQGILGFMPPDILKEVRRAQRLKCTYCHTKGASIGCNTSRCNISFHFPCGVANEANFEFVQNYKAYCKKHTVIPFKSKKPSEKECPICMQVVEPPEKPIIISCCKVVLYHKHCMQGLALNAGYFFRCSLCNSIDEFPVNAKLQGIFVPEQDASWEREPRAYADLYQVYNHCDAEKCECPKGPNYGANKGNWMLARCRICGSAGTHRQCGKLTTIANWACTICLGVEIRTVQKRLAALKAENEVEEPMPSTSAAASLSLSSKHVKSESILNEKKPTTSRRRKTKENLTEKETFQSNLKSSLRSIPILQESKIEPKTEPNKYNNRARRTGVPEKDLDLLAVDDEDGNNNEEFDLSKIQIQPSCTDYFPYSARTKKKLAKQANCFPDWRHYYLRVNLVNIFIDAIRAETNPVKMTPKEKIKMSKSKAKKDIAILKKKIKAKNTAHVDTKSQATHKIPSKKRSTRTSNWSKGRLKSKKRPANKETKRTGRPKLSKNNVISLEPNNADNKLLEKPSSTSQPVLVGIRRSRESLLRLKTQSSNKNAEKVSTLNHKTMRCKNLPPDADKTVGQKTTRSVKSSSTSGNKILDSGTGGESKILACVPQHPARESNLSSQPPMRITRYGRRSCSVGLPQSLELLGSNDRHGSQSSNGISQHKATSQADRAKISGDKQLDTSRTGGRDASRSGQPSLETELRESARDIVARLRNLDPTEANAKLKILELNCPQLFRPNLSKK